MEIGKQIRKYRTERNMSQDELAEKVFVSRQTISNWENERNYFQYPAFFHPRWARCTHGGFFKRMSPALYLVSQSGGVVRKTPAAVPLWPLHWLYGLYQCVSQTVSQSEKRGAPL